MSVALLKGAWKIAKKLGPLGGLAGIVGKIEKSECSENNLSNQILPQLLSGEKDQKFLSEIFDSGITDLLA